MYKQAKIVAIVQARMGSSRLPGKVLKSLGDCTVLDHVVRRLSNSELIDDVIIATSQKKQDDKIEDWGTKEEVKIFRGSETNVLNRFYNCSEKYKSDIICRITADCPLIDYKLIDAEIKELVELGLDYISLDTEQIPRGVHGEILTKEVLNHVYKNANKDYHKEHVTYYIYDENTEDFAIKYMSPPDFLLRPDYRLTLDTTEDYKLLRELFKRIYQKGQYLSLETVINYLDKNQELVNINSNVNQKNPKQT